MLPILASLRSAEHARRKTKRETCCTSADPRARKKKAHGSCEHTRKGELRPCTGATLKQYQQPTKLRSNLSVVEGKANTRTVKAHEVFPILTCKSTATVIPEAKLRVNRQPSSGELGTRQKPYPMNTARMPSTEKAESATAKPTF